MIPTTAPVLKPSLLFDDDDESPLINVELMYVNELVVEPVSVQALR